MKGLIKKGKRYGFQAGIPKDVREHFDGRKKFQKLFDTEDEGRGEVLAAEADREFRAAIFQHRQNALNGKRLSPERIQQITGWLFGQHINDRGESDFYELKDALRVTVIEHLHDGFDLVAGLDPDGIVFEQIVQGVEDLLRWTERAGYARHKKPEKLGATLIGACEAWAEKAKHVPKTIAQYKKSVKDFTRWFELGHGQCYGASISATHVDQYVIAMMKRNVAKATIGRELSALRLIYKYGRFRGLNPFSGVNDRMIVEGDQLKVRDFTDVEMKKLLHPKHQDHPAIMIAAYSGMRLSEIASLKRSNVEKVGPINVFNLKTGGRRKTKAAYRKVPIHPILFTKVIRPLLKTKPDDFLIDAGSTDALSKRLARVIDEVTPDPAVRAHSFRHTFITKLAEAGVPRELRMAIAGHEGSDAHDRYTHASFIAELSRKIVKVRYD